MLKNKIKLKVLLIQLPLPGYDLWKKWDNMPLAAGYLKAMCYKMGLLEKVDIEILDKRNSSLSGDAKLVDIIVSKSPDILGLSLYCWNSSRSLFIAKEIKKKLPNVKVIVGGPEVTIDSKHVLDDPVIDIGCIGEGEFTFTEIISNILQKKKDFKDIKGLFYRKSNEIIVTPRRAAIKTIDIIPSPYLLGIIDLKDYEEVEIETARGCSYRCTYCRENLQPQRFFSLDRIRKEIQLAISKGAIHILFIDASFLTNPNFRAICEILKNSNVKKDIFISVSLKAENLNEEKADLLKDCGVRSIEIGLQSCNPVVLKNINRPSNLKKFIDGIHLLKKKNIRVVIDLIIGLPGETLESFKGAIGFLKDNRLVPYVFINLFSLAVLPGTELRKEKDKYGIEYQEKPPYLVIKTNSLSESDIKKCYEMLSKSKLKKRPIRYPLITSHLRTDYPSSKDFYKKHLFNMDIEEIDFPVTKIIIEFDANQDLNKLESLGKRLRRKVGNPLTIWFIGQNIESNLESIKSFLRCISMRNPYVVWNIYLQTQTEFNLSALDEIKKCITYKDDHLSNPARIYIILPLKENRLSNRWLNGSDEIVTRFWHIEFIERPNWKRELEQILKEKGKLFVVDFHSNSKIDFILQVLKFIRSKRKSEYFLFKNAAIGHLEKKDSKRGVPVPKGLNECILGFDKKLRLSSCVLPNRISKMHITAWRYMVVKKHLIP